MATATHAHPIDESAVKQVQQELLGAPEAERLASLLVLLADPVRVRVLFALASVRELCVGDLALALDVSMDQSSYALKQLRAAGVVTPRRDGRVMYYRLADGFPNQLLEHCLRELLNIANQENVR